MTFVSYAQNHEDVMLARAFRSLQTGFYIDVGAQDPRIDSVTKAFYDLGWRGINLEPVESWYQKLCQDRPRDINLRMAAGAAEGQIDFYEVADTGLSTSSADFARRHQAGGHALIPRKVQVRTLDAICAEQGVEQVHFLKIDAEGAEADVLRGIDLARLRPWVILVEATEPNSTVSTHGQWESLLVDRGYSFVYDDGLNRFYLATEHAELRDAFAKPPNVHDEYILRQILDHQNHEVGLEKHIAAVEELSRLRAGHIERLDRIVIEKDEALAGTHASLNQAQAEVTRLHEAVVDRETRFSALHRELTECVARLSERDSSLASLRGVLAEHENELQLRNAQIALLAARLQGSEQAVAGLSRSLLDSQASRQAAEAGWAAAVGKHAESLAALAQAQKDFQDILSSRSWRLTSPLRRLMTMATAARAYCVRAARGLVGPNRFRGIAAPAPDAAIGQQVPELQVIEPPGAPARALPISDDAELILARCPVLDPSRTREGAR